MSKHQGGARKQTPRSYVAWDGEGVTNADGSHSYIMLVTTKGRKQCPCGCGQRGDWIINPLGLSTLECLDFYWKHARASATPLGSQKPASTYHVIYGGSYDFNCWVRDIDRRNAKWLWQSGHNTRIGSYLINYNNRSLAITRGNKASTLWDVVRFWQASFVKAITMCVPDFDELEHIKQWKLKRSDFHSENLDDVLHYCLTELRALVTMMRQFDNDLKAAGIGRLFQLNGAGSIAAKLLTINHVKKHLAVLPDAVTDATLYAYSGGRIELWRYGHHVGPFYTYDVVSAYPSAMRFLPSLADGKWERTNERPSETDFGIYGVHFSTERGHRGYPFFQRIQNGNILYPRAVNGWYSAPALLAAARTGFDFDVVDGWKLQPANGNARPFDFVPRTFDERARLKADGRIGAQLQLKLGLNSLYGKLAQTVGGTAAEPPPFHCLVWAANVTERTRATVFTAACQAPDHVAYISTDGIGVTTRLDLEIGKQLGQWEFTEYSEAILVQAGVYFLRCLPDCKDCAALDLPGGRWHPKYRGFDAGSIDPDEILRAWKRKDELIEVPATRFITLGSALNGNRFKKWCRWETKKRDLHLYGGDGKRYTSHRSTDRPWLELCNLVPTSYDGLIESHRYQPKWNDDLPLQKIDGVDMDTFEDEMVAYDNEHRAHHAARQSVLQDYFAHSK